ncbi:MAG TPA: phage holin family protein [Candidatus Bathyarchaeia archaeon]|nr:phage holin family protein [Candidatus Bathyarchaeia archaeon]
MLVDLIEKITLHPSLVLVTPALLVLGYALKQTPNFPRWMIIWILLIAGSIAGIVTIGFTVNGISNGIISAGAAITIHQMFKQTMSR